MTISIRRGLLAAVSAFALTISFTPAVQAQQTAAVADNPELAAKGVWDDSTTYVIDDIVTSRGSTWRSKRNNNLNKVPGQTSPSTAAYWELFARGFNPAGEWLNTTKYQPDDLVTRQGQTYRAKLTNTNRPPTNTTYWELLAAKGAAGAQGEQGPAGPNTGIADGTSSTPGISFAGDPNTGIYQPEHGKIALVEGGTLFLHNIGTANTALGIGALSSNISGQQNTALGDAALQMNSSGARNTALGELALRFNTSGNENTAVGASVLGANTGGHLNTAVGARALLANTSGNNNTALGTDVMVSNTTGSFNIGIGSGATSANTTGQNNVAVGLSALASNQTGDNNVAIGRNALSYVTTTGNTAVGHQALYLNTTGFGNVAVGIGSLEAGTTAAGNTAIGASALGQNGIGDGNIAIGYQAGYNANDPTDSIFIGHPGSAADDNIIRIGLAGAQQRTFIAGISGITTVLDDAVPVLISSAGQLGTTSSSRRYKFDIEAMADVSAMLGKLRPVTFRYKQAQNDGQHPLQYGLIAEEVAETFPDLAVFKDGAPETVKYHLLPSFLLAGYQAQQKTIETLNARDRQQTEKIDALEARLARIEAMLPQTKAAALQ